MQININTFLAGSTKMVNTVAFRTFQNGPLGNKKGHNYQYLKQRQKATKLERILQKR